MPYGKEKSYDGYRPAGQETPKEYREIVTYQFEPHGWRYDASRKGHSMHFPADRSQPPLAVPTTPTRSPRAIRNFVAEVRRRGRTWPPPNERR